MKFITLKLKEIKNYLQMKFQEKGNTSAITYLISRDNSVREALLKMIEILLIFKKS